ncbi:MAG: hypothetical protein RIT45_157 [Pseudomonadota bacterium]|jgi:peptidylprolyl isomerase
MSARRRLPRARHLAVGAWFAVVGSTGCAAPPATSTVAASLPEPRASSAEILAGSAAGDWRRLDPERTVVLRLAGHPEAAPVVFELAPTLGPRHVDNVRKLVRAGYFDGLAIVRVQENYVVQWGDPDGKRPLPALPPELPRELDVAAAELPFTPLPDGDVYAPEVGWSDGFPAGRDPATGRAWMLHCYGAVGVGRDNLPDAGQGNELYAVIGHAPRHLDRNLAMVGRIVAGMPTLTTLPRGTGALGFYERPEQRHVIAQVRIAADLPAAERPALEILRTDTPTFAHYVASRRFRRESWFAVPTGRVEVCNVPIPVRSAAAAQP